ncbi:hypothetical protein AWB73_02059 [Caballeronia turbans]|jgi:hypothetical protein|nr:hypothetical protein AWB73_02059 [Caballeronia turbans]
MPQGTHVQQRKHAAQTRKTNTQDKHGRPFRRPSIYLQTGCATSRPAAQTFIVH